MNNNSISFWNKVSTQFSKKITTFESGKIRKNSDAKAYWISNPLPSPVSSRPSSEKLNKSKYHGKNYQNLYKQSNRKEGHTYIQVLSGNIKEILKIKDNFFNLSFKKIKDIHKAINSIGKLKLHINMTTKGLSHKKSLFL